MSYIMVTNWGGHWDNLPNNIAWYSESMLKGHDKNKLISGAETFFIKINKETKAVEKCWIGKVYDFKNESRYGGKPGIEFRVEINKEIRCPEEYLSYKEGWYSVNGSVKSVTTNLQNGDREAMDRIKQKDWWPNIQEDFITKHEFGKRIKFVTDKFKRAIIFRDVEQAYALWKLGFNKPAVIIAGGVIEELLRIYLQSNNVKVKGDTFFEYIKLCNENGLLKSGTGNLSNAFRDFRNMVHLKEEENKKHSISKATANGAVASIFTVVNNF